MKVYLLITIDTECDKGPGWKIQKPMRFSSIIDGVPNIFNPLFNEFYLRPTYLLSPEIIANEECVAALKASQQAELGTHLHGEFIEPQSEMHADRTYTPQLMYTPDIEQKKLLNLTNLFEEKFGYPPTSFRAGRWGISKYTLHFLEELGYLVDSSVCPFRTHNFQDETSVNFWGAPLQPYHPANSDFRKKGKMRIWEMPATLGNPDLIYFPRFILRRLTDRSKIHKRVLGKLGRSSSITWLRPFKSTDEMMFKLAKQYVKRFGKRGKPVFLNMMFHSNEIIPGGSPYVQTPAELNQFLESLRQFFGIISNEYDVEGIGLSDVAKIA